MTVRDANHVGPGTAEAIRSLIESRVGPGFWYGFQRYATEPSALAKEWRFGGTLGFGGKVYIDHGLVWVSAYPEDMERDPAIGPAVDDLNDRLKALLS